MWANISKDWFARLSKTSIVFLVLVIIDFIIINVTEVNPRYKKMMADKPDSETKYTCYENATVSYIVNIVSMAANFTLYSYLEGLNYASDKRWSQFMVVLAGNIIFQLTGAIIAAFLMFSE